MPHDRDGNELRVGDVVYIPARITTIELTESYCNVTVETSQRMPPHDSVTTIVLNSVQTVKGAVARTIPPREEQR